MTQHGPIKFDLRKNLTNEELIAWLKLLPANALLHRDLRVRIYNLGSVSFLVPDRYEEWAALSRFTPAAWAYDIEHKLVQRATAKLVGKA
jgi:hypothetical protein